MPVPEASMHEDDGIVFRQDDVGFAGEGLVFGAVDGEPVAEAVEHGADHEFGFGVFPLDAAHHLGAFFLGPNVRHGRTLRGVESLSNALF